VSLDPERSTPAPLQQPPRPIRREDPEPPPAEATTEAEPSTGPPMEQRDESSTVAASAEHDASPTAPALVSAEPSDGSEAALAPASVTLLGDAAAEPSEERPPSEPVPSEDTRGGPPRGAARAGPPRQGGAPAVPQGPIVPFAAPPTERDPGTFAMRLIFGILGGVLLIAAVLVALVVAVVQLGQSVLDRIEETAEAFMTDIAAEDWDGAYEQLCADLRERGEVGDYSRSWSGWDTEEWRLRPPRDTFEGTFVPVELGDGSIIELTIVAEGDELGMAVCGWRGVD
jgi:hypothetical protein